MNNKYKDYKRFIIYKIILDFVETNKQLKLIINNYIDILEDRDKKFVFEIANGSIQNYLLLSKIIKDNSTLKVNSNKSFSILIFSIYNLLFSKKIPNYAIINSAVNLAKELKLKNYNYINALLRKISRINKFNYSKHIMHSYNKWLYDLLEKQYNNRDFLNLIKWNNTNRDIFIRCYTKLQKNNSIEYLTKNNIRYKIFTDYSDYIQIYNSNNRIVRELINKNGIYVQSPSSGMVVRLLNPKKNDIIIDACSSPGGKLIDISKLLNNNKKIYAFEINKSRYNTLVSNIDKYKLKNINTINNDFKKSKIINANKILIDAPCTGTGIIHRKPDIKIRRTFKELLKFKEIQLSLLNYASNILVNNGVIVYSTCSILDDENWDIVDQFLKQNNNFTIVNANNYIDKKYTDIKGALNIIPSKHSLDGMFAIKLQKVA